MPNFNPNEQALKALKRLLTNEDFNLFIQWLKSELELLREESDDISEINTIFLNQGARQAVKEVIEFFNLNRIKKLLAEKQDIF